MLVLSAILTEVFELCQAATHPASEWKIADGLSRRWKENREANAAFVERVNPEFTLKLLEVVDMYQDLYSELLLEIYEENPEEAHELINATEQLASDIFKPVDHSDKH